MEAWKFQYIHISVGLIRNVSYGKFLEVIFVLCSDFEGLILRLEINRADGILAVPQHSKS